MSSHSIIKLTMCKCARKKYVKKGQGYLLNRKITLSKCVSLLLTLIFQSARKRLDLQFTRSATMTSCSSGYGYIVLIGRPMAGRFQFIPLLVSQSVSWLKCWERNFVSLQQRCRVKAVLKFLVDIRLECANFYFYFFIFLYPVVTFLDGCCSLSQNFKVLKGYVKTLGNWNAGKNNSFENLLVNADD